LVSNPGEILKLTNLTAQEEETGGFMAIAFCLEIKQKFVLTGLNLVMFLIQRPLF